MKLELLPLLFIGILAIGFSFPVAYAQFTVGGFPSMDSFRPWIQFIVGNNQFPDSWLVFPNIVYYLVLPFISIVAVVYGIISDLRIFRYTRWVRGVLAVAMAGMTLPSGWLITAVLQLYSFNAAFAAIMFGIVFFVGVILWAAGTFIRMGFFPISEYSVAKAKNESLNDLRNTYNQNSAEIQRLWNEVDVDRKANKDVQGKLNQIEKLKEQNNLIAARKQQESNTL